MRGVREWFLGPGGRGSRRATPKAARREPRPPGPRIRARTRRALPNKITLTTNLAGGRLNRVQATIVHGPLEVAFARYSPNRNACAWRCRSLLAWVVRGFLPAAG